ncbi:hypothetical protein [Serratia phage vB_SmaM_Yaphecito]|uniref:Uncharacterized protein n=1 Tax=Serratia phage vB_SmaM_Yaphecito TaxID=2777368 RepID=A0A7T3TLV6_9CAUD|nr:hypothetical protein [Serratia phage vB_SmaM_Yaphecito]
MAINTILDAKVRLEELRKVVGSVSLNNDESRKHAFLTVRTITVGIADVIMHDFGNDYARLLLSAGHYQLYSWATATAFYCSKMLTEDNSSKLIRAIHFLDDQIEDQLEKL